MNRGTGSDSAQNLGVINSIDRPIRPLVIELNRIGLPTCFSCCGYTYEGQEEPKSHSLNPFVMFRVPEKDLFAVSSFFRLSSIVGTYGWVVHSLANGYEWGLNYNQPPSGWTKHDNLAEPIHEYELKLINITKLVQAMVEFPSCAEEVTIEDGNKQRRSKYGDEWMVAPKRAVVIDTKVYTIKDGNLPIKEIPLTEKFIKEHDEKETARI